MKRRALSLLMALVMVFTLLPVQVFAVEETADNPYEGKTISILGDSISTFSGVSNDTSVNGTLKGGAIYYSPGTLGVYREDTWWQQTIDALGMELLVNNSWSGSCVLHTRSGTAGAYADRCVQLHNDKTGGEPDVIAVFLGTNDFSYYQSALGTADIDYDALITADGYAAPTTTCEAYAIMLHKMTERYPDAEIYCMTMLPRRSEDYAADGIKDVGQPTAFNAELTKVIEHFGCTAVDLENCGITSAVDSFDTYITDKRVHPGPLGMDKMTEALVSAMYGRDTKLYSVSYSLNGVTCDESTKIALSGESYTAKLSLLDNYTDMDVTVTMGGTEITEACYSDSVINVSEIGGDIVITATGTLNKEPESYRWEFDGSGLVSCGDVDNALTKQAGTVTDGVFGGVRYSLATPVLLAHDAEWTVEWKCSGNWSGMLLSSTSQSDTAGMNFLFRTYNPSGLLAFGEYSGRYNNYGIATAELGLDMTVAHTYRLENRIADDGSNMAYLSIDGTEIGAMNNYYIAGTNNQNKTVNWIGGKDFVFGYMGSTSHPLKNMALEYIAVNEDEGAPVISVMGDSISTYGDTVPAGNAIFYPTHDVTSVEQMWWHRVITELDGKLGVNESWSGSRVLNTLDSNSGNLGPDAAMASMTRIRNLGNNGTPDVILFFGGTNDIAHGSPLGSFTPPAGEVDLTATKWDTYAEAYSAAIARMKYLYPDAQIVAVQPTENKYYYTETQLAEYSAVAKSVCDYYGVTYCSLVDGGFTKALLADATHPSAAGMEKIAEAVIAAMEENQGHTHSYENGVCTNCGSLNQGADGLWVSGTIDSQTGLDKAGDSRLRTSKHLKLADYAGVSIGEGYTMTWLCYASDGSYLGTSGFLGGGVGFSTGEIKEKFPNAASFRIALRAEPAEKISVNELEATELIFYAPGEDVQGLPEKLNYTDVMTVGGWQDGAIYGGKLFLLNGGGNGAVYDMNSAKKVGGLSLKKTDKMMPHANSVCFGTEFYADGDQYPLLYVNVYNNYASAANRMEGTCCVYRIVESGSNFAGELVQVIRVGFVEDLTMWKSKSGNGDVRPYGNFLVDTDENKLYAYVMRDAEPCTRFFQFALPKLSDGVYNSNYGCNVVTLNTAAIERRFDLEYFNYLQGGTYYGGNIYSAEGVTASANALRIVKLSDGTLEKHYRLSASKLTAEPEVVCVDPATGNIYYAAADGILRKLDLTTAFHTHTYTNGVCTVCGDIDLSAILSGKYVSVLGDSISTFNGYSNDASVNTTIGGNGPRYDAGAADTKPGSYCLLESVNDTWWMDIANRSGMELLVNNSWAGSQVFGGKTSDGRVIPAAYLDRCVNLHDDTLTDNPDNAANDPDVIFVYLGINDYNFNRGKVGSGAVDYAALVNSDGSYAEPTTFGEAYGIMLHKMQTAYPDAQIFAMTLLPENLYSVDKTAWEQHNAYIRAAAEYYDIPVVDLAKNCEITWDNYSGYMIDKIHPTTEGMALIADCIEGELQSYYVENPPHSHSYTNGICTVCGDIAPVISLRYDDRYDVSGKTVEIVSGDAVTLKGDTLVATGIGTADVKIDGVQHAVTVEKAKINLVMIMGQSNAGNHFANATSAVTCPPGTAYWWKDGATAPVDYTEPSKGFHTPLLAELYAQSEAAGDPVKNVMLWSEGATSKNGQSIVKWAVESGSGISTAGTDKAAAMMKNCLAYYQQHSDKYEIVGKYVYWLQGESDYNMDPQRYIRLFTAMWERLKGEGMEYLAFLRVRGPLFNNTDQNVDTVYNAASSAQFELVRSRADMFMATTLTEAWTGTASTSHSVDVSKYITVQETYGKSPTYSDSYGNKATYANGVLTTTMKELYGSNNKVHYGIFGYGLIGADAAYNMYRSLHGGAVTFVQTDSSGRKAAEHIAAAGSVRNLDIEGLQYNLSFYPGCGSPAGTMEIIVTSEGEDITEQVISTETDTYGTVSVEALRKHLDPVITVKYTHGGKTDEVRYEIKNDPCATGHAYTSVITAPTCTEGGYTTHTCTYCGDSYVDSYTEPKGYDYMLEDGALKLLLIGNSFSEDASNCGQGMNTSQLLDILQAMVGPEVRVEIGLAYSGGKSFAWHATQAEQGTVSHGLRTISSDGQWTSVGSKKLCEAVSYTDWDIVTLQPYGNEAYTGEGAPIYPEGEDEKFYPMENSAAYLLDYVAQYAPQAEIYYYMIWVRANQSDLNASKAAYDNAAAFTPTVLTYRGTQSGARFADIIPVGTAIQNARTTYLAKLAYNTSAYADKNLNLQTDAQIGLQRDGAHLSFNVGRYLAALTFAETIVPKEMRVDGYVLPDIRITESIGKLPKEYTNIVQKSVFAAVNGWNEGSFAVTDITGYTEDPTVAATEKLKASILTIHEGDEEAMTSQISDGVLRILSKDFAVENVKLHADSETATITIRFGYTSISVDMAYTVAGHSYTSTVTAPTCTEKGYTTHTCTACGDSYVDSETEPKGHTAVIDKAVAATCTESGLTEGKHCSVCGAVIEKQNTVPATGHEFDLGECTVCGAFDPDYVVPTPTPTVKPTATPTPTVKPTAAPTPTVKPTATPTPTVNSFEDVNRTDWFYDAVRWAVENKVTGGTSATTFSPDGDYTRAQVVTFLWAANDRPEPVTDDNPFEDVSEDDWFYTAVLWAAENDITAGTSATTFSPDDSCTRAQVVTFLYAASGRPEISGVNFFTDVSDVAWYVTPVIWAVEHGITTGVGEAIFGPDRTCTRSQIVQFLYKAAVGK